MLENLIGKEVVMIVSFSNHLAGSIPAIYEGTILEVNGDLVKANIIKSEVSHSHGFKSTYLTGPCIINKNYIISIFEK